MEIKVEEYCRTIQGYIAKVTSIDDTFIHFDNTIECGYEESPMLPIDMELLDGTHMRAKEYIVNHDKEIINLIEEGDYVNGTKVIIINGTLYVGTSALEDLAFNGKIESIATHEQFKGIEYKVGG